MWFRSLFDYMKRRPSGSSARRRPRRPRASWLQLEALEDRRLLTLNPVVNYAVGANPLDVVVGDFSGDGIADLAAVNASQLSILPGNGDGTFQAAQYSDFGSGSNILGLVLAAAHFNGGGRLDLARTSASGSGEGFVHILLNNGTDANGNVTFQPIRTFSTGANTTPGAIAVGDLNGDGMSDVVAAQDAGSNVTVLLGNGTGGLQTGRHFAVGANPGSVALGDFSGDNRLDIATANWGSGDVSLLLNDGNDSDGNVTFQAARSTAIYGNAAVAVGDLNADGSLDLAGTSTVTWMEWRWRWGYWGYYQYPYYWTGSYVNVLLGNGDGTFAAAQSTFINNTPQGDLAVADFNGDGNLDVVTADGPQTAGVDPVVLLGLGDGSFDIPYHFSGGCGPVGIAVDDFNGDSAPDVSVANHYSSNVSVLTNGSAWPLLGAPYVSVSDVTVTEGNTGTTAAVFTVSLSAAFNQAILVPFRTVDGTASAGSDYQATSGTVTFNPGETSKTITVPVLGDRSAEPEYEYFSVELRNPDARIADGWGTGNIGDNEPLLSIGGAQVTEGNTGTTTASFPVTMLSASEGPVTVNWSTTDGSATAGGDYQAASGVLTFNPGAPLTQTVSVLVNGDRIGEYYSEYFYVSLSNGCSTYGTILDDEPVISIGDVTVIEGNTGTTTAVFTVSVAAAYDQSVSINFSTTEGDGYGYYAPPAATAGSDFQSQSGSVTFAPGQTSRQISIVVNGDRLFEEDEYFSVDLAYASANAAISDGHAVGIITDDEPRISINDASLTERNNGTRLMTFTVTLSAAYDQAVTVNFATEDGDATVADNDYVAKSGSLTFAAGQTTATFTVTIKGDRKREWDENFFVVLSNASSNALISDGIAYGIIRNDDWGR